MIFHTSAFMATVFLCAACCAAATPVEIVIDEPHRDREAAWPVTTGVPFPRGGMIDETQCRLVDDRGKERPLQSRVAATWDRDRSSIRWLTIDFIAEPGRRYALEFGEDVRRRSFNSPLSVERDGDVYVATGAITAAFHADGPAALGEICADLDGDGEIEPDEVVAAGDPEGEHYYLDQNGRRFSSAGDGDERIVVVESAGPVRACVRVDGFYTGPKGERIVAYRTRYHFYAGLGAVKCIDEFKIIGSTRSTRFKDVGFSLRMAFGDKNREVSADSLGSPGNQVVKVAWRPDTESVSLFQETYRHFGNPDCRGGIVVSSAGKERALSETEQAGEWMQVAGDRRAVTGSLRRMWQQFPKEWRATRDRLTLHLWSPRAGELDFGADGVRDFFGEAGDKYVLNWKGVRGTLSDVSNYFYFAGREAFDRGDVDGRGICKHHEFWLHIAAGDRARERGAEIGKLAAKQPLALATGEWNCSTDVFGPLIARPNDSKYEAIVDRIFDLGRKAQDDFGDYGWWAWGSGPHYSYQWDTDAGRHYADPRRFEYHTYQKETQLWWNYLRSGERKFYDWAFPSEDHWVDIAVTHVPLTYECAWKGGERKPQTLHFRPGDWSIDSALFYVRHRDSAEAWLRGGSQFWASYHRTLETTTLAYYLTGDERYADVIEYWREYWGDLAGKTSASNDVKPWHREQPWFTPTAPGGPEKSWAEMIRDYAPFTSGLRHQMTQFFNLATLYEHTWDAKIGQALDECAAAYLDPDYSIGVWRTQENEPPNNAAAPKLAHYWVPALCKYHRATGDERMPDILRRYFRAGWAADPFRGDVGRYSNVHLAYAWYYTRDSRHLRAAQIELDRLMPEAAPLARPEDLGRRLYNPYAPIRALTAVPRLVWALDAADQAGVAAPPPPPLKPQRTAIALLKQKDRPLRAILWGYDRRLKIVSPDGEPFDRFDVDTKEYASDIQPFDRSLPNYEVYLHHVAVPADAPAGYYVLSPTLEMALLESESPPLVCAARPIAIDAGEECFLSLPAKEPGLAIESASASSLTLLSTLGEALSFEVKENRVIAAAARGGVRIRNTGGKPVWFRVADRPDEQCWASFAAAPGRTPGGKQTSAAMPKPPEAPAGTAFVVGRFGNGLQVVEGRRVRVADHLKIDGTIVKLFEEPQGAIEFWVKRQWDDRLTTPRPVTFVTNGVVEAWPAFKLPLGEWAHVAVEWRPLARDKSRQAVHIYIDGRDEKNYRSTWWNGYSQKPFTFRTKGEWLKAFVIATQPGAPFVIDELRVSSSPRYTKTDVELGHRRLYNPARLTPPSRPFSKDDETLLLMHFDGDLSAESNQTRERIIGDLSDTK